MRFLLHDRTTKGKASAGVSFALSRLSRWFERQSEETEDLDILTTVIYIANEKFRYFLMEIPNENLEIFQFILFFHMFLFLLQQPAADLVLDET